MWLPLATNFLALGVWKVVYIGVTFKNINVELCIEMTNDIVRAIVGSRCLKLHNGLKIYLRFHFTIKLVNVAASGNQFS